MRVWPGKRLLDKTVVLLVSYRQTWHFRSLQNNATRAPFLASTLLKDLVPNLGSGFLSLGEGGGMWTWESRQQDWLRVTLWEDDRCWEGLGLGVKVPLLSVSV